MTIMANNEGSVSATIRTKSPQAAAADPPSDAEVEDEEDYTSSSGSSSDDEHTTSSTRKVSTPMPAKNIRNDELRSRLTNFLSGIEQANRELSDEAYARAQRIDDVDEHEDHYIEMNLGLGVLDAQSSNETGIQIPSANDQSEASIDGGDGEEHEENTSIKLRPESKLVATSKPKIEEINDTHR